MNPSMGLAVRARAVELCRMPSLAILLTLEHAHNNPEGMFEFDSPCVRTCPVELCAACPAWLFSSLWSMRTTTLNLRVLRIWIRTTIACVVELCQDLRQDCGCALQNFLYNAVRNGGEKCCKQCCGSVTFWYGSRSGSRYFVCDLQDKQ
jgi:hypothetical protein